MLLPGEIEYRKEIERRRSGIPIPATLHEELVQLGKDMNLDAARDLEYV
jgi:L-2-hydroxycarboxylate dehydrogenase (NAD+)